MPLDDLADGLLRVIGRLILHFFLEIVFEILIKGAGYLILKPFYRKKELDADGWAVTSMGIVFWLVMAGVGFYFFSDSFNSD